MNPVLQSRNQEKISSSGGYVFGGKKSAFLILHSSFSSAFTLIELIVTIVVIGIVLLALVMSFQESLKLTGRQNDLRGSSVLVEDLMNEVRCKYFVNPQSPTNFGPEPGETLRRQFNDVDDYNGWTETPPRTVAGVILSNFTGFTRRVSVANVTATNFNGAAAPTNSTDFKRITVVVSNGVIAVSNMSVVSRYD